MQKKLMLFKTKGMNQDMSVSAFNPEFSFENINLRLSTNEGNTQMSWVNEKGTKKITLSDTLNNSLEYLTGIPIGTAVLNHKLIVFTTTNNKDENVKVEEGMHDYIYQLEYIDSSTMQVSPLYKGNLNFHFKAPLETMVKYESSSVQKVYWVDNRNQPRFINIAGNIREDVDTQFDFIPSLSLKESVTVTQNRESGGSFPSGVIQYCISYYNKYGQQSNIVYVSPLFYLAYNNRGASAEETVNSNFTIEILNPDSNFDYVRLYSVQRTSVNTTPIVKVVEDLKIENASTNGSDRVLNYTDIGTTGYTIDPTELLFIGGKSITALTMTEKDGTLFLGNVSQKISSVESLQNYYLETDHIVTPEFTVDEDTEDGYIKEFEFKHSNEVYPYQNSLRYNNEEQSTFKGGETYRFGFQLQNKQGEWSEPIFLNDVQNNKYPTQDGTEHTIKLPYATLTLDLPSNIDTTEYVNARPLVVFPNAADRDVVCQGVLNPTVFNVEDRKTGTPFSQASWFFRPYSEMTQAQVSQGVQPSINSFPQFMHYSSLHDFSDVADNRDITSLDTFYKACNVEIQGSVKSYLHPYSHLIEGSKPSNTQFMVDQSIVTLNSPDIEFDPETQKIPLEGLKLRIVGTISINASASSHSITTSSDKLQAGYNMNFWKKSLGSQNEDKVPKTYGNGEQNYNVFIPYHDLVQGNHLIAGNIWNDGFAIDCARYSDFRYEMIDKDPNQENGHTDGEIDVWGDSYEQDADYKISVHAYPVNFFVHPWNRQGPLNNDYRSGEESTSLLKTKRLSNLLFSINTKYLSEPIEYSKISAAFHLTENDFIYNINLPSQKDSMSSISYYPNIDKVLTNPLGYKVIPETFTSEYEKEGDVVKLSKVYPLENIMTHSTDAVDGMHNMNKTVYDPIPMKYKSTSHAVIALNSEDNVAVPIMPCIKSVSGYSLGSYSHPIDSQGTAYPYDTFWGDTNVKFTQPLLDITGNNVLFIGELYRDRGKDYPKFGGKEKEALKSNTWLIGGDSVPIKNITKENNTIRRANLRWTMGDTYYQRYDCLKTYMYTPEDINQVVEILSFMCETHTNIEGRYDNNRGKIISHSMNPQIFNLLNPVYSQFNNFFNYKRTGIEDTNQKYPNWIYYSKTKENGADIDLWTNVTLASMLELEGDKGELRKLTKLNDQIIAFQDSAVSQVRYNENVQISSTNGVPIEIANSGKVDGKRILNSDIGCSNKWSVVNTPSGIYFTDSINKSIYLFNGEFHNLGMEKGFSAWCKQNIPSNNVHWDSMFSTSAFRTIYDKQNQDVLFINKDTALAFSEKFGVFTSFYDYGNSPWLCNIDGMDVWLKSVSGNTNLWEHQKGEYCNFFGEGKGYSMTLIGNSEPLTDKIFTNLEFRAIVDGDGTYDESIDKFTPTLPFDSLEAWNEYQHGIAKIDIKSGRTSFIHNQADGSASLKRKYRIWRCDIPRNNYKLLSKPVQNENESDESYQSRLTEYNIWLNDETKKGIYRHIRKPLDRMRNPWLYISLSKNVDDNNSLPKIEMHDVVMTYYN